MHSSAPALVKTMVPVAPVGMPVAVSTTWLPYGLVVGVAVAAIETGILLTWKPVTAVAGAWLASPL